jgi:hypothetical protein
MASTIFSSTITRSKNPEKMSVDHLNSLSSLIKVYRCNIIYIINRTVGQFSLGAIEVSFNKVAFLTPKFRILSVFLSSFFQIAMQLRVYAIYNGSKRLAAINAALFALTIGSTIGLMTQSIKRFTEDVNPAMLSARFPYTVCPTWMGSHWQWVIWLPGMFLSRISELAPV